MLGTAFRMSSEQCSSRYQTFYHRRHFTIEPDQTNCLRRTNRLMWKRDEQIFRPLCRLNLSVCENDFLKTICLSSMTNKSTKVRPKFTLRRTCTNKWSICSSRGNGTSRKSDGLWKICLIISGVGRVEFALVDQTVSRFVRPKETELFFF